MSLEQVRAKMAELRIRQENLRKELCDEGKVALAEASKELFAKHENLKAFRWTQYTPYFNDGEECEFGINDMYFQPVKRYSKEELDAMPKVYHDDDGDEQWLECYWSAECESPVAIIINDCRSVRDMLDEDTLKELFGDHVEVTVTADGASTEEYEHD